MVSAVGLRPNHYAILGIEPAASDDDVKHAFTKMMSLFRARPMSAVAAVSAAYETLRDPDRRRAYDRSLGLTKAPEPRQWNFAVAQPRWSPFVASAGISGVGSFGAPASSDPEPHVTAQSEPRSVTEESERDAELDKLSDQIRLAGWMDRERLNARADRSFDWNRPLLAVVGLVAGAGILGGLAGFSLTGDGGAKEPASTVSVPLPAATQAPGFSSGPMDEIVTAPETHAPVAAKTKRGAPPNKRSLPVEASTITAQVAENAPDALASDPLAPQPAAQLAEAAMPLPKPVIARTIERIGYACGDVVSTAAVEGAGPGVFKVTCSSGQSYQARPVHGRYRFKRMG